MSVEQMESCKGYLNLDTPCPLNPNPRTCPYFIICGQQNALAREKQYGTKLKPRKTRSSKTEITKNPYQKYHNCRACPWFPPSSTSKASCFCRYCRGMPLIRCIICGDAYHPYYSRGRFKTVCKKCAEKEEIEKKKRAGIRRLIWESKRQTTVLSAYRKAFHYVSCGGKHRKPVDPNLKWENVLELAEKQHYCCALTGLPLNRTKNIIAWDPLTPSLDRIDNSKGYEVGNIRWVSLWANLARASYTDAEFYEMCEAATKHHNRIIP